MSILDDLLGGVRLPRMAPVRQVFETETVDDVAAAVGAEFAKADVAATIPADAEIAVAVGSRGLDRLPELVAAVVAELKRLGARPFVVPAMGSHGGAVAAGQTGILANLGVTEDSAGCAIRSSMDIVEIGRLENGLPVGMDRVALAADGIVVINRIKPHTSFSGAYESGLVKMIAIGLGNQQGAESCHALGFGEMARSIVDMAELKLQKSPIVLGVATVENAYDRISKVVALPAGRIMGAEPDLLLEAKRKMPRILFDPLDVLIVDRIGKEFSGTGADPNITGKAGTPYVQVSQRVAKMAVLDLTAKSGGNATGVGLAEVCTRRLVDKIDFVATYANPITSTVLTSAKIPMTMDSDRLAIQACIKTCNAPDLDRVRLVRIANTLDIEMVLVSEALLDEAAGNPMVEILGEARELDFDPAGWLTDLGSFQPRGA